MCFYLWEFNECILPSSLVEDLTLVS
jgi:hypothetical protein